MISKPKALYVWIWLPWELKPVVAGVIQQSGDRLVFAYGRSYLARENAEPIFIDELPLASGLKEPRPPKIIAGCLRDGAPDSWGRRVILNRLYGDDSREMDTGDESELVFLRESGSDRIGRLDFQDSPTEYVPRENNATLNELHNAAQLLQDNIPLPAGLADALQNGTAIGGARPKALLSGDDKKYIAKFSSSSDTYPMVKYEFLSMRLAAACGLNVATVSLTQSLGRDVLLIERFDRKCRDGGWYRRGMVSALTALDLDEIEARYASYSNFAQWLRAKSHKPKEDLRELFSRLTFNILCGNTDDHARNHAAFCEHRCVGLTPAYDICPQIRTGGEASQGMSIDGRQRLSQLVHCLAAANHFLLSAEEARAIAEQQIKVIETQWSEIAYQAVLSKTDRSMLWHRQLLNPYALEGF